ncbi:MAG: NHL repeat-containing protein [Candidatus Eremiobacteraeota bacterium]|nr:NHL repeat-containing protein [Candidatus Eremiobacteraeota bacterium]
MSYAIFILLVILQIGAISPADVHQGLPFYGPDNIVIDARKHVLVTDSDHRRNFRIIELTSSGQYVTEWHFFRIAAAPAGPEGIAIDARGRIFATDAAARRVLEIAPSGKILATFGGSGEFVNPGHVAVDARENLYVADAAANTITKLAPNGRTIASWHRTRGPGQNQFAGPESIALDSRSNLYVEDWGNHRLLQLAPDGRTVLTWGPGSGAARIGNSAGIAVDRLDHVYVADWARHRIEVFRADGTFLGSISNDPRRPARFVNGPTSVAVDADGLVYYADGNSVRVLDRRRRLVRTFS